MLSIKVISEYRGNDLHHILMLCENFFTGSGWHTVKDLTNEDILFLKSQGYSPYIENTNIPQSILQKIKTP